MFRQSHMDLISARLLQGKSLRGKCHDFHDTSSPSQTLWLVGHACCSSLTAAQPPKILLKAVIQSTTVTAPRSVEFHHPPLRKTLG